MKLYDADPEGNLVQIADFPLADLPAVVKHLLMTAIRIRSPLTFLDMNSRWPITIPPGDYEVRAVDGLVTGPEGGYAQFHYIFRGDNQLGCMSDKDWAEAVAAGTIQIL